MKLLKSTLPIICASLLFIERLILSPEIVQKEDLGWLPVSILEQYLANFDGSKKPSTEMDRVPAGPIPDYEVSEFRYLSTQAGRREWLLESRYAQVFNTQSRVDAVNATAQLFDSQGGITWLEGQKAVYHQDKRILEVFGDVRARFPDGFELASQYFHYDPKSKKISIPDTKSVSGRNKDKGRQNLSFDAMGLEFTLGGSEILLLKAVETRLEQSSAKEDEKLTVVRSDQCRLNRQTENAVFTMEPSRPQETRFVKIDQVKMTAQSRKAELNYAVNEKLKRRLNYLTALEDVVIEELGDSANRRYATAGRAEFDGVKNTIRLTIYPQLYQNNDTVTGEVIVMHRDTDVVEVDYSNTYSEGKQN